jgi:hypothetical protein
MLVALFRIGRLSREGSRSQFSARLFDAVELAHARTSRTVAEGRLKKTVYKNAKALDQDLQRGLKQPDEMLIRGLIQALIRWRKTKVSPEAGFYVGGRSHLMVTPLNPDLLTRWIDNAIDLAGARERLDALYPNPSSISPPKKPQQ